MIRSTGTHLLAPILMVPALLLACALALPGPASASFIQCTWDGGVGDWSVATAWSPDSVPNNFNNDVYTVVIDGGKSGASIVHLDQTAAISGLTVNDGDVLAMDDPFQFNFPADMVIDNEGEIVLNVFRLEGELRLNGAGTIRPDATASQIRAKISANGHLLNTTNVIEGPIDIDVSITNEHVMTSNVPGGLLDLNPDAEGVVNRGVIRAENGGRLLLAGGGTAGPFTNEPGGVFEALAGCTLLVNAAEVRGGTLRGVAGGVVCAGFGGTELEDLTLEGDLVIDNGAPRIEGTITNEGAVRLERVGASNVSLQCVGDVTLAGAGTLLMIDQGAGAAAVTRVKGFGGVGSLTNDGHTIRGTGFLGLDELAITNDGTIIAEPLHASSSRPLRIDPDAGGFDNRGTLTCTGTTGCEIGDGPFTTSGTVTVEAGSFLDRTGDYMQTAGSTTVDGTLDPTGAVTLAGGTLDGAGVVQAPVTNAGGVVAPGSSAGTLTIQGNFTQQATGTLAIEIGGPLPDTGHDVLAVTGSSMLDGTLDLVSIDAFVPAHGDTFVVLTSGSVASGTFSNVQTAGFPQGLAVSVRYDANEVVVVFEAVTEVVKPGGENAGIPDIASLSVLPNPAPSGVTRFLLGGSGVDGVSVYDVTGRLVRMISAAHAGGTASVEWDGRDDHGRAVSPGVYFVRLDQAGRGMKALVRKLHVVR